MNGLFYLLSSFALFFALASSVSLAGVSWIKIDPLVVKGDEPFKIEVKLDANETGVVLKDGWLLRNGVFTSDVTLYDDGTHGDRVANDKTFTASGLSTGFAGQSAYRGVGLIQIIYTVNNAILRYSDGNSSTVNLNYLLTLRNIQNEAYRAPIVTPLGPDAQRTDHCVNFVYQSTAPRFDTDDYSIMKKYFAILPDDRDFIVIEDTFQRAQRSQGGFYSSIRNQDSGFGSFIFDNTSAVGSAGKVLGYVRTFADLEQGILTHELLHRWAAYIDGLSTGSHWGAIERLTTGFGSNYGAYRSFTQLTATSYRGYFDPGSEYHYNDIELYLMGLMSAQEVAWPVRYLKNPIVANTIYNEANSYRDFQADGIGELSLQAMVSRYGERTPGYPNAQNQFKLGTIILSERLLSQTELAYFDMLLSEYAKQTTSWRNFFTFSDVTRGRGQVEALIPYPAIRMTAEQSNHELILGWVGGRPPYIVEQSSGLTGADWQPLQENVQSPLKLPSDSGTRFFRVKNQP